MKNYFFTADTHFNHGNAIEHNNRPFKNVDEMNEQLIQNWNGVVTNNDTIFHLGDFSWKNPCDILKRLNGYKIIILGNHDYYNERKAIEFGFKEAYKLKTFKNNHISYIMCHYPMYSWNRSHHGSYHVHGHIHNKEIDYCWNRYNVGVDVNNYTPVALDVLNDIFLKRKP